MTRPGGFASHQAAVPLASMTRMPLPSRASCSTCPWPKLDLKAVDQTVARSALSAMALKNGSGPRIARSEEHTSELQSRLHLVCRLLLEKKKTNQYLHITLKKKKKKKKDN